MYLKRAKTRRLFRKTMGLRARASKSTGARGRRSQKRIKDGRKKEKNTWKKSSEKGKIGLRMLIWLKPRTPPNFVTFCEICFCHIT